MTTPPPPGPFAIAARFALLAAALATLGLAGCSSDPSRPGGDGSADLSMRNCWPNDDGREWTFAATSRQLVNGTLEYLPPGTAVPPVALDDVQRLLQVRVSAVAPHAYGFRMRFSGTTTTASGVRAQNLVETLLLPYGADSPARVGPFEARLRRRIAEARLDPAAPPGRPAGPTPSGLLLSPSLVHGDAWIQGPAWIGTYGDADTLLAWKFLDANLRDGHVFSHQLVPSLADDVWLRGRVERRLVVDVPALGTSAQALEVIYLVDYGISRAIDLEGRALGAYRVFDYGRVIWVPGVGPVSDLERRYAYRGRNVTPGLQELELRLTSTAAGPGPIRAVASRHWTP